MTLNKLSIGPLLTAATHPRQTTPIIWNDMRVIGHRHCSEIVVRVISLETATQSYEREEDPTVHKRESYNNDEKKLRKKSKFGLLGWHFKSLL